MNNLEKIGIFRGVPQSELKNIFEKIDYSIVEIEKNELYRHRGSKIEGIYIIIEGSLSAEMLKENGNIQKIEDLKKSEIIAPAFIFAEDNALPVDLIGLEKTKIFQIDKKNSLKLFISNEKILLNFLEEISNRTRILSDRLWGFLNTKTIEEKLKEYISKNRVGNEVIFKHSLTELSELFSVTRPSLSRVISDYKKSGMLIKLGKNSYKVNY